ncbi:FecR family protein [Niabella hirudinis]|uniref:FecR family protein n=1 Tax=Niabella hirudinis TaxID=1285929 RepID=UPI003EBC897C
MSSNPHRLELLFKKYIDGACTQPELDELWSLLAELTDDERLSIGLAAAWRVEQKENMLPDDQWQRIYQRLHTKIRKPSPKIPAFKKYMTAAAVVLVLASGYLVYRNAVMNSRGLPSVQVQNTIAPVQTDTRVVTLPDGTEVILKKNSTLIYDTAFLTGATRSVHLTGEAYFDVAHDTGRPFIVRSGSYSIRVLGTAFNVNTTAKKFEVAVVRGKVEVEVAANHRKLGTLVKGNYLAMEESPVEQVKPVQKNVDADAVGEWTKQDLVFRNANWDTARKMIFDKYGVDVEMANEKLAHCRFTADVTGKSLKDCLDILCMITNASWQKKGLNTIYIGGDGCNQE